MAISKRRKLAVSPSPTEPKHKLIADRLLEEIESGTWTPGTQIPSEEQLAKDTGTSLGTVRRALSSLAEMGVVERQHGRGTFVSGARAPESHLRHFRFFGEGSTKLLPVYFRILDVEEINESGPWKSALNAEADSFIRISRIVSVNNEFEIFSEIYLPKERFPLITELSDALDGVSIRDLLAERFNAPTLRTRQFISCKPLPPRVTRLIGSPAGQYGMVLTVCGMSYRDAPVTWQRIFIPPSDRELELSCMMQIDVVG